MGSYGIIGVGTIATAIVTGLCEDIEQPPQLLLSPRNAARAAELVVRFPSVTVCADNQAVLGRADVVILSVRPQDAAAVGNLVFRPDLIVVSVMAGIGMDALRISPVKEIARAIPLPSVARREGVTAVYPPIAAALNLFGRLGRSLPVHDENTFDAFSAATATVAAHRTYMAAISRWRVSKGANATAATDYVTAIFAGRVPDLRAGCDLDDLASERATRGGTNDMFRDL